MTPGRLGTAVIASVIALLHLVVTLWAYSSASPEDPSRFAVIATYVLGFPLVYVERLSYTGAHVLLPGFDLFAPLVLLNSLLWGGLLALGIRKFRARRYGT